MALVDDMVSEVQQYGYDDFTATTIIGFFNDELASFANSEPFPFYETAFNINTTGGQAYVTLPSNFRLPTRVVDSSTGVILEPTERENIVAYYSDALTQTGDPSYYYLYAGALYMYPVPPDVRALSIDGLRTPAVMAAGGTTIDLPVEHKRLLILAAVVQCAGMEGDLDMVPGYQALYEKKKDETRNALWNTTTRYDRPKIIHDVYYGDDEF